MAIANPTKPSDKILKAGMERPIEGGAE